MKSYSLPQHIVSYFTGLLCSEQSKLGLGNKIFPQELKAEAWVSFQQLSEPREHSGPCFWSCGLCLVWKVTVHSPCLSWTPGLETVYVWTSVHRAGVQWRGRLGKYGEARSWGLALSLYAHLARFPSEHPSELGVWDQQGQEKSRVGEIGAGERAGPGIDLVRADPHTHPALGLQLLCWVTGLNTTHHTWSLALGRGLG